jgi:hypothetical protein
VTANSAAAQAASSARPTVAPRLGQKLVHDGREPKRVLTLARHAVQSLPDLVVGEPIDPRPKDPLVVAVAGPHLDWVQDTLPRGPGSHLISNGAADVNE